MHKDGRSALRGAVRQFLLRKSEEPRKTAAQVVAVRGDEGFEFSLDTEWSFSRFVLTPYSKLRDSSAAASF
jgi:hypothetical protein